MTMLYRQRLLLALAELAGGELDEAKARLLVMLLSVDAQRERRQAPYEFVVWGKHWRSFVLEHDLQTLRLRRYLTPPPRVALAAAATGTSFLSRLRPDDRRLLEQVWEESQGFAADQRSALRLLGRELAASSLPKEVSRGAEEAVCLFTLGYEGLSLDAYLSLLLSHGVRLLVDVRRNPFSHKFGFARRRLAQALYEVGIAYLHLPALGVPSELRRELATEESYRALFVHYATDLLPQARASIERLAALIAEQRRVALTCFEADPGHCHRAVLAAYLQQQGYIEAPIVHLMCNAVSHPARQNLSSHDQRQQILPALDDSSPCSSLGRSSTSGSSQRAAAGSRNGTIIFYKAIYWI
ncbi:hypothetical protein KTAU_14480 [Thermogemmatispora aurantia]|uniref:DUF488 domain-containing protein n=1 Tax=Thermogemmatispora aurantia TaxID=2045279 RepID=A0A5J4K808_9CHLR|nr:DUF488 domain-containing protein [Thermogemmatispora aurantia]GER82811.1 hypothetical protein KTAU_14480 [Thermogemmatispora aurantia]